MKKINFQNLILTCLFIFCLSFKSNAQFLMNSDSAFKAGTPMSGRVWGYTFGDFYYKSHSDAQNRGGANQYTGIPSSRNEFQIRRVYLGYDSNISKTFSAELLLAAEDNFPAFNSPSSSAASGDQLLNNKLSFYVKLANLRWKNVWKGTDLIFGQQATPAFPLLAEKIWSYRSVEKTITDIRKTPSYDMGIGLQGTFDPKTKNYGYNLLIANGTSAKPAANNFRWFYGDVYAMFFNKKIVVDLYADYQKLNDQTGWLHTRQMIKGYVAYTTPALTVGLEAYVNNIAGDIKATKISGGADTISTKASGVSVYVHGNLIKNKLRFFLRYDTYNPNANINNNIYKSYTALAAPSGYDTPGYKLTYNPSTGAPTAATSTGDITSKERFITAGLDYTPTKNVHVMPNIWYNHYESQLSGVSDGDYDMVYRVTMYYTFGK